MQSSTADFFGRLLTDKKDAGLQPRVFSSPASQSFRRAPFEVVFKLGRGNVLGLVVTPDIDPRFLVIDDIFVPSVVSDWNSTHEESLHLRLGDTIASVNGVTGNSRDMLAQMRLLPQGADVRLVIQDAPAAFKSTASTPAKAAKLQPPKVQRNVSAGEAWIPVTQCGYNCVDAPRGEHAPDTQYALPDECGCSPDALRPGCAKVAPACGLVERVRETLSAPAAGASQAPVDSRFGLSHFVAPVRVQH